MKSDDAFRWPRFASRRGWSFFGFTKLTNWFASVTLPLGVNSAPGRETTIFVQEVPPFLDPVDAELAFIEERLSMLGKQHADATRNEREQRRLKNQLGELVHAYELAKRIVTTVRDTSKRLDAA